MRMPTVVVVCVRPGGLEIGHQVVVLGRAAPADQPPQQGNVGERREYAAEKEALETLHAAQSPAQTRVVPESDSADEAAKGAARRRLNVVAGQDAAGRLRHPAQLAHRGHGVTRVMDDAFAVHDVELIRRERKGGDVALDTDPVRAHAQLAGHDVDR